jgi:hypothetical protein
MSEHAEQEQNCTRVSAQPAMEETLKVQGRRHPSAVLRFMRLPPAHYFGSWKMDRYAVACRLLPICLRYSAGRLLPFCIR